VSEQVPIRLRDTGGFGESAGYSRAVRVGRRIVVGATAPLDETGTTLHLGDIGSQTRHAFERAIRAVENLGGSRNDVVITRLYLVSGTDWNAAIDVHSEMFGGVFPANTTVFVPALIPEGALVEVEIEAESSEPVSRRDDSDR
jgi:enamine deaminase RidA (YjgF/YER057c/UK114 family)